ncbi:MAG: hypothetical protein WKF71_14835 [Pyrinomonadaceae bacterium]
MPFNELQRRIGRKTIGAKLLAEVPVILQCYDLLEFESKDIRTFEFQERRRLLSEILGELNSETKKVFRITEVG